MKITNLVLLGAAAVAVGAVSKRHQAPLAQAANAIGAATAPGPAPRSTNLFVRLYQDSLDDRLLALAAGVAFYGLLALVPSLAVAVSLFGLFADPALLTKMPTMLTSILPAEAVSLVQGEAQRLAAQTTQTLSLKLAIALALSLWGASASVRAVFDALNIIDEQQEARSIIRLYATAIAATLGGVIVFILAIALIGANPDFVALGALSNETVFLYTLLRWPLFFLAATVVIAALYWIGPSRPPASYLRLLPGAALAALLWALGSSAFGWYVATLGNYTATYGSLATVVVMMTWLWASAVIVLLGAQFNFELSRRVGKNTGAS